MRERAALSDSREQPRAAWQLSRRCEGVEGHLADREAPTWRSEPAFILSLPFCRQLDNNQISCIEDGAFRALRDLEIL